MTAPKPTPAYYTPEELARLVAESRAAQGLPPHLEDPVTVERVAALIEATPAKPEREAS